MIVEKYDNSTGLPSVSDILDRYVYKKAFKDFHRERGSYVHQAIKTELTCGFTVIDNNQYLGYFKSFQQYKTKIKKTLLCEKRFIDKLQSYTGKLDFAGVIATPAGDKKAIIDWKTSKSASKSMPIALAAYKKLVEDNNDIVIDLLINVLLDENGGPPIEKIWTPESYQSFDVIFRSAKQVYYYFGK